ncbi:AraC family transcriptional regulator [Ructibacterium gallinarum]|uniref:AraC family transcriptional regulator n=1 Tax=Ructibacterium gallinarum TaxID=2779355 RepID=A0A9D5M0Y8_9FIRM|nr:AraC family transcriptional regulator [Ructibacterium gallinarum]MBE5040627.1 AraC family transcriptional regulator [Ructibacterium gallinarum]
MLKRFQTVFIKLVASYAAVVILLSLSIGAVSYAFFSNILEEEITDNNDEMIQRTANSLKQQIFDQVESLWMETAVSDEQVSRFFETPELMTAVDYYNICQQLQRTVRNNSTFLYSMDIYVKESGMVISSSQGIKYLREGELGPAEEFRDIVEKGVVTSKWIAPRLILETESRDSSEQGRSYITFLRTIPYIRSENIPFKGYLAIKVREEAVYNIICSAIQNQKCEMMIVDQSGTLMSHSNADLLFTDISQEPYIQDIIHESQPYHLESVDADGQKAIVTSVDLGSGGLRLIRKLSFTAFYEKINTLRWLIALICLVLGAAGIGISLLFIRDIYDPLKNIVNNLHHFIDKPYEQNEKNEYSLINRTLTSLSKKVVTLEGTLKENMPVIRSGVVEELLTMQEQNRMGLKKRLEVCDIQFSGQNFMAIAITIPLRTAQELDASYLEYFRFDLIRCFQETQTEFCVYGTTIRDRNMGIIVNAMQKNDEAAIKLIRKAIEYACEQHKIKPIFAMGKWVIGMEEISVSYLHAADCLKYAFLMPEKQWLSVAELSRREHSMEAIPSGLLKKYYTAIRSGNMDEVIGTVHRVTSELKQGDYSYHLCERILNEMISFLQGYILEKNIDPRQFNDQNFYVIQEQIGDIYAFQDWLIEQIRIFLQYLIQNSKIENSALIERARQYIEENLDKDISLSSVAEKLYITAPYLSKLFKEEVGINFNNYVTKKRLEMARELVLHTNASVNEITQKVGFNSSTYLIKKFKEAFGDTPVNYKKRWIIQQEQEEE